MAFYRSNNRGVEFRAQSVCLHRTFLHFSSTIPTLLRSGKGTSRSIQGRLDTNRPRGVRSQRSDSPHDRPRLAESRPVSPAFRRRARLRQLPLSSFFFSVSFPLFLLCLFPRRHYTPSSVTPQSVPTFGEFFQGLGGSCSKCFYAALKSSLTRKRKLTLIRVPAPTLYLSLFQRPIVTHVLHGS